jgi:hypothetical protein
MKEDCVKSEITRSAAEEARKKAREDLEAEQIRSHGVSNDVDRVKKMCWRRRELSYKRVR